MFARNKIFLAILMSGCFLFLFLENQNLKSNIQDSKNRIKLLKAQLIRSEKLSLKKLDQQKQTHNRLIIAYEKDLQLKENNIDHLESQLSEARKKLRGQNFPTSMAEDDPQEIQRSLNSNKGWRKRETIQDRSWVENIPDEGFKQWHQRPE